MYAYIHNTYVYTVCTPSPIFLIVFAVVDIGLSKRLQAGTYSREQDSRE